MKLKKFRKINKVNNFENNRFLELGSKSGKSGKTIRTSKSMMSIRTIKEVAEEFAIPIVSSTIVSSLGLIAAKMLHQGNKKYIWLIPGLIIGGVGAYY